MLFRLLAFLVMIVHWIACIWYLVVGNGDWVPPKELDYAETIPGNLWTKTTFFEKPIMERYAMVFYYAV